MKRTLESLLNPQVQLLPKKTAGAIKKPQAIRLDKGELPFLPSLSVQEAIKRASLEINRYPELMGGSLRFSLANYCQSKSEQIIVGNGSDDLIELILKAFVGAGDQVILPTPTFFIYDFATRVVGGENIYVARNSKFDLDLEQLIAKVTAKTKLIFLANPNNPTANLTAREKIIELLELVDCLVVVDECYYEIAGETVVDLIEEYPNLIVLRSLSKSFGLAGIRLGYSIANEGIIDYLYRIAQLFPVNKLALAAGEAALKDLSYTQANISKLCVERESLKKKLEDLDLVVYPSATNFLFVRSTKITSENLVAQLAQKEIYVADFGLKQGLDRYHWRTSVGSIQENELLVEALQIIHT